jgi:dipeptidase E
MKFYLSSYRLGDKACELVEMLNGRHHVALILNALDGSEFQSEWMSKTSLDLAQIGLQPQIFDLRKFFGRAQELAGALSSFDCIFVNGGNTFVLRKAMHLSGLDKFIVDNKDIGEIVYAGFSAGICVLAPTLHGIDLVDNPDFCPPGYEIETIWEGLSILPYSLAPHYKSDHHESKQIDDVVSYFIKYKMLYKTLRDGEVIILK